jgi:hypothetical protein
VFRIIRMEKAAMYRWLFVIIILISLTEVEAPRSSFIKWWAVSFSSSIMHNQPDMYK